PALRSRPRSRGARRGARRRRARRGAGGRHAPAGRQQPRPHHAADRPGHRPAPDRARPRRRLRRRGRGRVRLPRGRGAHGAPRRGRRRAGGHQPGGQRRPGGGARAPARRGRLTRAGLAPATDAHAPPEPARPGAILRGMPTPGTSSRPFDVRLPNGLRVLYEPMPWLPTLSATLLLPFGSATDPAGAEGSANVLHEWLQRGAGDKGSRALSDAFEDLGVRRSGGAGRETSTLGVSFLAEDAAQALPLFASLVRAPRFEEPEFEPSRELALQELESLEDAPTQRLFEALSARFFASPQRRSPYGDAAGLAALTPEGVRQDAARRLGPDGAVLALAGGASWEELAPIVEDAFGGWT